MDRDIELRFGGSRMDRHGYLLAQVFVVSGESRLWLQDELIGRGLARVYSLPGVWDSWAYGIEDALDVQRLGRLIHSYQLVEGTVLNVDEGGGRVYLNFTKIGAAISPSALSGRMSPLSPKQGSI